jgi:hypothetical protein
VGDELHEHRQLARRRSLLLIAAATDVPGMLVVALEFHDDAQGGRSR